MLAANCATTRGHGFLLGKVPVDTEPSIAAKRCQYYFEKLSVDVLMERLYQDGMTFSEFLQHRMTRHNLDNMKEHYEGIGGKRAIGISLRHFQQLQLGTKKPSVEVANRFLDAVEEDEKHLVPISYFNSHSIKSDLNSISGYLRRNLIPCEQDSSENPWNREQLREASFSHQQLEFLSNNRSALRLHLRTVLYDRVSIKDCRVDSKTIQDMIKLELIKTKDSHIYPFNHLYTIPKYQNSSNREAEKGLKYYMAMIDEFIDKIGNDHQAIGLKMQLVSQETAAMISERIDSLNDWIKSLAEHDSRNGKNVRPLFMVTLSNLLQERDLW